MFVSTRKACICAYNRGPPYVVPLLFMHVLPTFFATASIGYFTYGGGGGKISCPTALSYLKRTNNKNTQAESNLRQTKSPELNLLKF